MTMKIIILNGPNLNLLGEREKKSMVKLLLAKLKKDVKHLQKKTKLNFLFFSLMLRALLLRKYKKLEILTMV